MKIRNLLLVAVLSVGSLASAQDNLKMILKDGSELVGYISCQRPGENLTFATHHATILVNALQVKSIVDNQIKVKDLPQAWKDWAETHDALVGNGNDAYLVLSDIIMKNKTVSRVRILQRGVKVEYLEMIPNTYTLSWDTIAVLKAEPRPKLLLSGINRKYKLRSGMEFQGQYVEEVPGKTLSLYQDDGIIRVFSREDVLKDNRYKINPNQSLFEQSDLIDIVQLKDGNSYKGVIIERNYSDADTISNDYLLIQSENGSIQSINLADILEYRKERNPLYNPLTDVLLKEGEFMVNRRNIKPLEVKEIENMICLEEDSITVTIPMQHSKTDLFIESKFTSEFRPSQLELVKLVQFYDKKKKIHFYGLTYEDILKEAIQPVSIVKSVNDITRMTYELSSGGVYALYDAVGKKALLFKVVN